MMILMMIMLMIMIYEFVSHQHFPQPVSSYFCDEVSNGSTLIRRDKCWRSTMKRQIERDLWVFCQALTKGVGKKWVCVGSASLAASTKNIGALRTNMTLENHNFKQEIHLPMVGFSIVMWVFRGCTTSIPRNIPRIYPKLLKPVLVLDWLLICEIRSGVYYGGWVVWNGLHMRFYLHMAYTFASRSMYTYT